MIRKIGVQSQVILKTQKMVLDAALLNTQNYKVSIKGEVKQSRECIALSPTPWYSSYWKGSHRVTLDHGRQLQVEKTPVGLARKDSSKNKESSSLPLSWETVESVKERQLQKTKIFCMHFHHIQNGCGFSLPRFELHEKEIQKYKEKQIYFWLRCSHD